MKASELKQEIIGWLEHAINHSERCIKQASEHNINVQRWANQQMAQISMLAMVKNLPDSYEDEECGKIDNITYQAINLSHNKFRCGNCFALGIRGITYNLREEVNLSENEINMILNALGEYQKSWINLRPIESDYAYKIGVLFEKIKGIKNESE